MLHRVSNKVKRKFFFIAYNNYIFAVYRKGNVFFGLSKDK